MRTLLIVITSVLLFTSTANADVTLYGNLVIRDSSVGAKIMGEVINDTSSPITDVEVIVIARNGSGNIIDEPSGWVDGYTDPETGFDDYIPAGETVPFLFFADVDADEIISYEYSISYDVADVQIPDLDAVHLDGDVNMVSDYLGTTYYGEIENLTSDCVYYVSVVIASKDAQGNVIDVDSGNVCGRDYITSGSYHTETLIQPGQKAPFDVMTLIDLEEIDSYNLIINYRTGPASYDYYGEDNVVISGTISTSEFLNDVKYTGEISNGTDRDIYFTKVTIVSRNSEGTIIDIYMTYVDGTEYEVSEGISTESHIAPGATAPFEVYSDAPISAMDSYEYIINYQYAAATDAVADVTPLPFTLDQNFPNPFNPATTIGFSIPDDMQVSLRIYNMAGQLVDELVDARLAAGTHEYRWNASGCPSGVYIYVLSTGGASVQRKMTLVR